MRARILSFLIGLQAGIVLAAILLAVGERPRAWMAAALAPTPQVEITPVSSPADVRTLANLERRLARRVPSGPYLVVSSSDNTFRLMQGNGLLLEGPCSTGSYIRLKAEGDREWLFNTPRGIRRIESKRTRPVWTKPDWAFIEEGEPVPPPGSPLRYERGVLGKYALSMGDGYLVHGTPYERLLGMPVSHGCIRLGASDLEAVHSTLPIGAPVYIY
ncbi:MAG: L,D-transpeptidase [Rhodothermales bacterium]